MGGGGTGLAGRQGRQAAGGVIVPNVQDSKLPHLALVTLQHRHILPHAALDGWKQGQALREHQAGYCKDSAGSVSIGGRKGSSWEGRQHEAAGQQADGPCEQQQPSRSPARCRQ